MRIERQCKVCGKTFQTYDWQEKYGRGIYCSRACYKVGYREHFLTSNPNPSQRLEKPCEMCGKIMQVPPCLIARKRFCSKACLNQWKRTITGPEHPLYTSNIQLCEWCGKGFKSKPAEQERRRFCSKNCHGMYTAAHFPKGQTSIEATIANLLANLEIEFVEQKQLGMFLCDFALLTHRLVIECDGTYWHGTEEQKAKDQRKDGWLHSHGYRVLRLKETDINQHIEWCRTEIIRSLLSVDTA